MNLRAKLVFSIGFLGLLCLMLPGSLRAGTVTFDSINTNTSYYVDISTTNYLAQYGITLTNVTPGTMVDVMCANAQSNGSCSTGTGYLIAESAPNVLVQQGGLYGESYTLAFSNPLSSLSFSTAGQNVGSGGNLVAAWSATAYSAGNVVLSSVGDPSLSADFSNTAPTQYVLTGPGIASVTFYSNCAGVCGEQLAIDNLSSPQIGPTPEPSSLLLFGTGFLLSLIVVARRKQFGEAGRTVLTM